MHTKWDPLQDKTVLIGSIRDLSTTHSAVQPTPHGEASLVDHCFDGFVLGKLLPSECLFKPVEIGVDHILKLEQSWSKSAVGKGHGLFFQPARGIQQTIKVRF